MAGMRDKTIFKYQKITYTIYYFFRIDQSYSGNVYQTPLFVFQYKVYEKRERSLGVFFTLYKVNWSWMRR